jgi:hypothetical protein
MAKLTFILDILYSKKIRFQYAENNKKLTIQFIQLLTVYVYCNELKASMQL